MKLESLVPKEIQRKLGIDFASAVLTGIYMGMVLPFMGIEARRLGASPTWVASLAAAMPLGSLLCLYVSDKVLSRGALRMATRCFGLGRAIMVLAPLVALFAPQGRGLIIVVFISYLVGMLGRPGYSGVMGRVYPNSCRSRMMGYARMGVAAGQIPGALVGGFMLKTMDPHTYLIYPAIIGVLAVVVFSRIDREGDVPTEQAPASFSFRRFTTILRANRPYTNFVLFSFFSEFGAIMVMSIGPVFCNDVLAMTPGEVAALATVGSIMSFITYFLIGRLIDNTRPVWLVSKFQMVLLLSPVSFILALHYRSIYPLLLSTLTWGVLMPAFDLGLFRAIVALTRGGNLPRYDGIWAAAFGVRGLIAPFVSVALLDLGGGPDSIAGYMMVFISAGILIVVGSALNMRLASRMKRLETRIVARSAVS